MYIPEFWCGVIATVLVEIVSVTIMIIISTHERKDKNENNSY